jgi:hypothetical protein
VLGIYILLVNLFALIFLGNINETRWAYFHSINNKEIVDAGQFFNKILRANSFQGEGLYIGNDRYGSDSYFLLNLSKIPFVRQMQRGSIIQDSDITNKKWLITSSNYVVNFHYKNVISKYNYSLYIF